MMNLASSPFRWIFGSPWARADAARRSRRAVLSGDWLEGRVTPAHFGPHHHAIAAAASSFVSGSTGSSSSSSSNSTLTTARQTLQNDIQTIELASGTTVGELTAIRAAFKTLSTDGLTPTSNSALSTFEDTLVTDFASGTDITATGNPSLLSQFEALYTSSPTTQETTDLTTAYNALVSAVTSSNITSANIATIGADWTAVLSAESSTSTASFPYFTLVTGGGRGGFGGMGGGC